MPTKGRYRAGSVEFYESTTSEVMPVSPYTYYDDFVGTTLDGKWTAVDAGAATEAVITGNGGLCELALDATNEAQDAGIQWNDVRSINVKADAVVQFRFNLSVLPTTGVRLVMGLCGGWNLDKDTVAESAWFSASADGNLDCETDDTTNNSAATSVQLAVAGTFYVALIDFTVLTDVRFYLNDAAVGTGTTFDMSNLTDAEALMQPCFSLDKANGTGLGTLELDYVRAWADRTA